MAHGERSLNIMPMGTRRVPSPTPRPSPRSPPSGRAAPPSAWSGARQSPPGRRWGGLSPHVPVPAHTPCSCRPTSRPWAPCGPPAHHPTLHRACYLTKGHDVTRCRDVTSPTRAPLRCAACKIAHKVRGFARITCAILTLASLPDLFVPTFGPFLALRGDHGAPRADGSPHLMCANGRISAPYVP